MSTYIRRPVSVSVWLFMVRGGWILGFVPPKLQINYTRKGTVYCSRSCGFGGSVRASKYANKVCVVRNCDARMQKRAGYYPCNRWTSTGLRGRLLLYWWLTLVSWLSERGNCSLLFRANRGSYFEETMTSHRSWLLQHPWLSPFLYTLPLGRHLRCCTNELWWTTIEVIKWRGRGPRKPYMQIKFCGQDVVRRSQGALCEWN